MIRRVVGKSMLPGLRPGQIAICWRAVRSLSPGRVIVIRHDGLEKIKRISEITDQDILVLGDNSNVSTDSRDFGRIPRANVIAKVIWPLV